VGGLARLRSSPALERIRAPLLAITSADDERNPPETGIMRRQIARVKNGRAYLIPAGEETRGHGTTGMAKFWRPQLEAFLASLIRRHRSAPNWNSASLSGGHDKAVSPDAVERASPGWPAFAGHDNCGL
jgi:hypothetical protein